MKQTITIIALLLFTGIAAQDLGGIVVNFSIIKDTATITEVFKGGPADMVGIKVGDKILSVDNVTAIGLTMVTLSNFIRGEVNTPVTIELLRGDKLLTFQIMRKNINSFSQSNNTPDSTNILSILKTLHPKDVLKTDVNRIQDDYSKDRKHKGLTKTFELLKSINIQGWEIKVNSRFTFLNEKLESAFLRFPEDRYKVIAKLAAKRFPNNTYPKNYEDYADYMAFSDSFSTLTVFQRDGARDGSCGIEYSLKNDIKLFLDSVEKAEAYTRLHSNYRTTFSDMLTLYYGGLWVKETKVRELYISDKCKTVPNGFFWRVIKLTTESAYTTKAAIYLKSDNLIPVNYFDIKRDIGQNDSTDCYILSTLDNLSIVGAIYNINIGSYPISTMPLDFVSGFNIQTDSPKIKMLVYEYKLSPEQIKYLENNP